MLFLAAGRGIFHGYYNFDLFALAVFFSISFAMSVISKWFLAHDLLITLGVYELSPDMHAAAVQHMVPKIQKRFKNFNFCHFKTYTLGQKLKKNLKSF